MTAPAPSSYPLSIPAGKNLADRLFYAVTAGFAGVIVLGLAAMAAELARASLPALREFGLGFVVGTVWDPVHAVFGALPFIYGTIVSSALALFIAVPIAIGAAVYLSELAPEWQRAPLGFLIELLAAVPSVVYGLWGALALAPWLRRFVEPLLAGTLGFSPFFRGPHQGFGMLAGGIVLAIMILPTIASVSREVLRAVPSSLREGALALGATRSEMLALSVLPYARSGLFGATLLGLGRALGETMAVAMVIGNRAEINASLFAPSYTMASGIANEFAEATSDLHLAALAELGLVLLVVTVLLNAFARLLVSRVVGKLPLGGTP